MLSKISRYFRRGRAIKLPSAKSSYAHLLGKLEENEPFAFSRWGDGEWEAVLDLRNENDANCDGHQYFPSLKRSLQDILGSCPQYLLGMQELAYYKLMGGDIDRYLRLNNIHCEWMNADAFHDASVRGTIGAFFNVISTKRVLLVGPAHLRTLNLFLFNFCEVPAKNCWLQRDVLLQNIRQNIASVDLDVILFCAGMTSNWFIHILQREFSGSLIDVGSLLDPYAGVNSRNYHKKLAARTLKRGVR